MTEQQITETEEVEQGLSSENVQKSDVVQSAPPEENSSPDADASPDGDLDTTEGTDDEQDTFPREYVEKLRDESARYRQRAGQADDLAAKLHTALVTATGRLMNADDLEFDETHLDDPEKLTAAIDELLEAKPYLGKRTPKGDIGQGASGGSGTVNLVDIMRSQA